MKAWVLFFFFKQKTAYEMLRSLVGSEMCIRDSFNTAYHSFVPAVVSREQLVQANSKLSMSEALTELSLIHI